MTQHTITSIREFIQLFLSVAFLAFTTSLGHAQMSNHMPFENDSLSLMIQQWHALPEASVQTIGLAAGAKGVDEVPGALHVISPEELERYSYT
jgi:hypothetical protein